MEISDFFFQDNVEFHFYSRLVLMCTHTWNAALHTYQEVVMAAFLRDYHISSLLGRGEEKKGDKEDF